MSDLYTRVIDSIDPPHDTGTYTQKRIAEVRALGVFAAIHTESQLEAILFEVELASLARVDSWPSGEGFRIETQPLDREPQQARLSIRLTESRYRDLFLVFANDISEVLTGHSRAETAVRAVHQRVCKWQEFLKEHGPDGLSEERQAGLFGELHILENIFLARMSETGALSSWRGCRKANQDFQFRDFALEVKTCRAAIPSVVHISNIEQLTGGIIEHFFLTVVHVHQNESEGDTLPGIISRIRSRLDDPSYGMFSDGLAEVGYLDVHAGVYSRTRYLVREVLNYQVGDGFPRLLLEQIPEGVKAVKYQIGLDACQPYRVEAEAVIRAVQSRWEAERHE
jgi:hypothetical protein